MEDKMSSKRKYGHPWIDAGRGAFDFALLVSLPCVIVVDLLVKGWSSSLIGQLFQMCVIDVLETGTPLEIGVFLILMYFIWRKPRTRAKKDGVVYTYKPS
jgi:hypothetical protein